MAAPISAHLDAFAPTTWIQQDGDVIFAIRALTVAQRSDAGLMREDAPSLAAALDAIAQRVCPPGRVPVLYSSLYPAAFQAWRDLWWVRRKGEAAFLSLPS